MAEARTVATAQPAAFHQLLTFRLGERRYALPAAEVAEVIRAPPVARMPQAPASLLGVANLRGEVLPVASLSGLLGGAATPMRADCPVIVLAGAAPAAVAVDKLDALVLIDSSALHSADEALAAPGERLLGAFETNGSEVTKVLDVKALLAAAFTARSRSTISRAAAGPSEGARASNAVAPVMLASFEIGGQEFALGVEAVLEIIPGPSRLGLSAPGATLLLGVVSHRQGLLPLLSLRGLLGFPIGAGGAQEKIIVVTLRGAQVGLVVDKMLRIVAADPARIDPAPPILAARAGGETRIQSIYRDEEGSRLISILTPDALFREEVMRQLQPGVERLSKDPFSAPETESATLQFLVFRLAGDEFALPIDRVDEVAEAPQRLSKIPKAPAFLEGVVNFRGEVLPVVDQRRRFDLPPSPGAPRRLVVVRTARHRAGLIVDSVVEVRRCDAEALDPAPDLTGEATRLVTGVINLPGEGRIILVLDPEELLTRAEHALLDAFQAPSESFGG